MATVEPYPSDVFDPHALALADLNTLLTDVWNSAAWRVRPTHIIIPESVYLAMQRLRRAKWKLARRARIVRARARIARARRKSRVRG